MTDQPTPVTGGRTINGRSVCNADEPTHCLIFGAVSPGQTPVTRKPATDERTIITLNIDATGKVEIN